MKVSYIVCDNEHCGKKLNDGDYVSMHLDNEHYDLCRECADKIKNMLKLATRGHHRKSKMVQLIKRAKSLKKLMYMRHRQRVKGKRQRL